MKPVSEFKLLTGKAYENRKVYRKCCDSCYVPRKRKPPKPRTPEQAARYKRKTYYGLTEDDYQKLLASQSGGCGICGTLGKLCVDHDHTTGKVRGLLCAQCNFMIGHAREKAEVLRLGAVYIEKNK